MELARVQRAPLRLGLCGRFGLGGRQGIHAVDLQVIVLHRATLGRRRVGEMHLPIGIATLIDLGSEWLGQ
ncbi:hypothetical protein D3C77_782380 [compost metagenome]